MEPGQVAAGLPCVNCKNTVVSKDAKFFDGVFLCPNCHAIAQRTEERLASELNMMRVMLHEAIRVACCEGRLHLSTESIGPETSKKDVLEAIVSLTSLKQARKEAAKKEEPT